MEGLIGWAKWGACCAIVGSCWTAQRPQTVQEVALMAPILVIMSTRIGRQLRASDWLLIKHNIFLGGGGGERGDWHTALPRTQTERTWSWVT